MKPSQYNYIVPEDAGYIFFNGITESMFRVSSKNREAYESIINNPDINYDNFKGFIDRMLTQGFIIDDDTDEDALVKQKYEAFRRPGLYEIMILPTYQCNLRCWYCTQDHADQWLSDLDIEKIKRRIEIVLKREDIQNLHITWFGGEPLLAYDRIVELSEWAQQLCKRLNKVYSGSITTNATLLTKERIEKLHDLGMISYQITIDGDKMTHNSIKVLGSNSAFDISVSNITEIARHTRCILRFNYTKDNLKTDTIIEDLKSRIPEDVRANITFMIYKVWQECEDNIDPMEVLRLARCVKELGMRPQLQTMKMCYADYENFECVFSNGKVGKCDNANPGSKHVCGTISDDGSIIWDEGKNYSLYGIFDEELDAKDCIECKYLPICWGPCPMKREQMMYETGEVKCIYGSFKDEEVSKMLINQYYNIKGCVE